MLHYWLHFQILARCHQMLFCFCFPDDDEEDYRWRTASRRFQNQFKMFTASCMNASQKADTASGKGPPNNGQQNLAAQTQIHRTFVKKTCSDVEQYFGKNHKTRTPRPRSAPHIARGHSTWVSPQT